MVVINDSQVLLTIPGNPRPSGSWSSTTRTILSESINSPNYACYCAATLLHNPTHKDEGKLTKITCIVAYYWLESKLFLNFSVIDSLRACPIAD